MHTRYGDCCLGHYIDAFTKVSEPIAYLMAVLIEAGEKSLYFDTHAIPLMWHPNNGVLITDVAL